MELREENKELKEQIELIKTELEHNKQALKTICNLLDVLDELIR